MAGILCESCNGPNGFYVSVGVGINLKDCPPDCAKLEIDRQQLLEKLSLNLKQSFDKADRGNTMFDQIQFQYFNERI